MKKEKKTIQERERLMKTTPKFPPDNHWEFCKRCFAFNKGCPNTGSRLKDKDCFI